MTEHLHSSDILIRHFIKIEGGYSDHPLDSGGKTKYGITESTARASGYQGPMRDLTEDEAVGIYREQYWDTMSCAKIWALDQDVTYAIYGTGIHLGPLVATQLLQRALNVLNDRGSLYEDLEVDGLIGDKTTGALHAYLYEQGRDLGVLLKAYMCLKGARLINLAERRPKDQAFIYGWIKNRVTL